jgi:hypothetical protein
MKNLFYYIEKQLDGSGITHDAHTGELLKLEGTHWRVIEIQIRDDHRYVYCTIPTCLPKEVS